MSEPNWNEIIGVILKDGDDDRPTGIDEHHFTVHSKNISIIDGFHYNAEWIETRPVLFEYLKGIFTDWWEDLAHDDFADLFSPWLDGGKISFNCDSYIGETLVPKLLNLYKECIVETHECSVCGKTISEKHPYKHPDSLIRLGHPVNYPDGIPKDTPSDEIIWENRLYCHPCWEDHIKPTPESKGP